MKITVREALSGLSCQMRSISRWTSAASPVGPSMCWASLLSSCAMAAAGAGTAEPLEKSRAFLWSRRSVAMTLSR